MEFLRRIRNLLASKLQDEGGLERKLRERGFEEFLYATAEGLPIGGTFEDVEELSARLPELFKSLASVTQSDDHILLTPTAVYVLIKVTEDVVMLAKGRRVPGWDDIEELKRLTRRELKL